MTSPAALLKPRIFNVDDPSSHIRGFPRGAITELYGPPSSGRTSLTVSVLAEAAAAGEVCAWVDADDAFDPVSAAAAGVALDRLLWVRCRHNPEHALRAVDLLVQGGGFGMIVFDLGGTPVRQAQRIPLASWFRLRRAVEPARTALVVTGLEPYARQAAALSLGLRCDQARWSGTASPPHARLLDGLAVTAERRKPVGSAAPARHEFPMRALG
jgi:hypothetical protein